MIIADWRDQAAYDYTKKHSEREWGWEFLRRNPDYQKAWLELGNDSAKEIFELGVYARWRITSYINPSCNTSKILKFEPPQRLMVGVDHHLVDDLDPMDLGMESHEMAAIIDIHRPLPQQLKKLKSYLLKLQKSPAIRVKRTTFHKNTYLNYLRVLDAKDSGAQRSQAAAIIFANKINPAEVWTETLKQANAIRQKGYRELLA